MMNTSSFIRSSTAFLFVVSITLSVAGANAAIAVPGSGGDAGDTPADATTIDGEKERVNGVITASDSDWYAVELEKGQSLFVRLALPGNRSDRLRVGLYGPNGKRISVHTTSRGSPTPVTGSDTAVQTSLNHTIEQSGTYYVRVVAISKNPGKRPYTLTVATQSSDTTDSTPPSDDNSTLSPDDNDSTRSPDDRRAVPIRSGETIRGSMDGDNREYFSIRTEAGDALSIETTFGAPSGDSGTVYVYGPEGKRIRTAKGGDIRKITAEDGGVYTIVLVSVSEHNYTLTATLSSNRSSARNRVQHIKTSQTVRGALGSTGEIDWYAVEIEKGQGFTVRLEHTNRKDPATEMSFEVYNPNRKRIGEAPFDRPVRAYQTGPAAASAYGGDVAERSGTYYIGVKGSKGANYSLTVDTVELDEHDPNEQPASATPISVGNTVSGVLTGYDRDVYAVDLRKRESITVEYSSTGAVQPSLWVAGPRVTTASESIGDYSFGEYTIASSGTDDSLTFTANRTGTYYIKTVPYFERSTAATFFESAGYEMAIRTANGSERTLTVKQLRTATVAPSTETIALNTTVRTATRTPMPTPTTTATPTPTTTATLTPHPTTRTTVMQTADENGGTTPPTTTADGPGFGVLLALVGLGGGVYCRL